MSFCFPFVQTGWCGVVADVIPKQTKKIPKIDVLNHPRLLIFFSCYEENFPGVGVGRKKRRARKLNNSQTEQLKMG